MASATLQSAIEKSHHTAANAVADIQPHAEELRSDLSGYKDEIVSAVGSAYQSSRRGAMRAVEGMGDAYDTAKDYTLSGVRSATRAARTHPLTTVAIAAGLGLLVGAFLMLTRRR